MSNARPWKCSISEYHADLSAVSHSGLDIVLEDPARYHWERILKMPREEKTAFEEGQQIEDALIGGDGPLGSNLVEIPKEVLSASGSRAGHKWEAFEKANAGRVLCKRFDPLWRMLQNVKRHDAARELLTADGERQATIVWHNDRHGVDVKCRFDFLHLGAEVAVDLKSTRTRGTLDECKREVEKWGYFRQAALYIDGAEELYGVRPHFVFVFVSKVPPYRVETFELDDDFIRIGREQNDEALATYAACLKSGEWVPKSFGRIPKLSPSNYLRSSHFYRS